MLSRTLYLLKVTLKLRNSWPLRDTTVLKQDYYPKARKSMVFNTIVYRKLTHLNKQ